ncbi:hypothetical protein [Desulfospira joergensenii]|uniref:hypothetical protein n=1 Tax=Desulfospira joergensenii TaxID=53329 RepID=UPI0003B37C86|nr:hypothetical protein [Desulfospira joergensenii]
MENKVNIHGDEAFGFTVTRRYGDLKSPSETHLVTNGKRDFELDSFSLKESQRDYDTGLSSDPIEIKTFKSEALAYDSARQLWGKEPQIYNSKGGLVQTNSNSLNKYEIFGDKDQGYMPIRKDENGVETALRPDPFGKPLEFPPSQWTPDIYDTQQQAIQAGRDTWGKDIKFENLKENSNLKESHLIAEKEGKFLPMKKEDIDGRSYYTVIQKTETGPQAFTLNRGQSPDISKGFDSPIEAESVARERWGQNITIDPLKMNNQKTSAVVYEKDGKFIPRVEVTKDGNTIKGTIHNRNGESVVSLDREGVKPKINFAAAWSSKDLAVKAVNEAYGKPTTLQVAKVKAKNLTQQNNRPGNAAQRLNQMRKTQGQGLARGI